VNCNYQAAKSLAEAVSCAEIFRAKAGLALSEDAETDPSWFNEMANGETVLFEENEAPRELIAAYNFLQLECLVRALDSMETVASAIAMVQV
jgi:nuclear pore complex protein Nup107